MSEEYAVVPITVAEGGGLYEIWELQDEDGVAINITGDTFTAEVRAEYDTSLTMLLDISPTISDATAGKILWSVEEDVAELVALPNGTYVYDLFRDPGSTPRLKIAQGTFTKTNSATDF